MNQITKAAKCAKTFFENYMGVDETYPEINKIQNITNDIHSQISDEFSGMNSFSLPALSDFVGDLSVIPYHLGGLEEDFDITDDFLEYLSTTFGEDADTSEATSEYDFSEIEDIPTYALPAVMGWWDKLTGQKNTVSGMGSVFFVADQEFGTLLEIDVEIELSSCSVMNNGKIDCSYTTVQPKVHTFNPNSITSEEISNFICQRIELLELDFSKQRPSLMRAENIIRNGNASQFVFPENGEQTIN